MEKGKDSDKYPVLCRLLSCNLVQAQSNGRGFLVMVDVRERAGRGVRRVTAASLAEMKPSAPATRVRSRPLVVPL